MKRTLEIVDGELKVENARLEKVKGGIDICSMTTYTPIITLMRTAL
ncbi:MAG: hypothetical protein LBL30_02995 [Holosporales bacterium]|jgi:hypothetical protein|nr:hypothetical protein [Holosporales bacterium]